jgi:hypothetical protein
MSVLGAVFLLLASGAAVWYLRRNTPSAIERRREIELNSSRSGRWYVHDSDGACYLGKFFKFKDVSYTRLSSEHLSWRMGGYVIDIDDGGADVEDYEFSCYERYMESELHDLEIYYREAKPEEIPKLENMLEKGLKRRIQRDELERRREERSEMVDRRSAEIEERKRAQKVKSFLDKY